LKTLYYDCFAGISGDMAVGALIDLGADVSALEASLKNLPLSGYDLRITRENRRGITGTRFEVVLADGPEVSRTYGIIRTLIGESGLPEAVRRTAFNIFNPIAVAEAAIHGEAVEEVHFHEIGAVDSIVDIVGYALCLEQLGIERTIAGPPELGGGTVTSRHGVIPVPAPATLEILKGIPVRIGGVPHEATTPTGAAILAATVDEFTERLFMVPEKIGYGLGRRDPEIPNVLRAVLGRSTAVKKERRPGEALCILECTIDDMNPEIYEHVLSRLLEAGALEAFLAPVIMKKSRPGVTMTILCRPEEKESMENILFQETTTLGVRGHSVERRFLERRIRTVSTPFGPVRVKEALQAGKVIRVKPEFEDCRKLAETHGVPLGDIYRSIKGII